MKYFMAESYWHPMLLVNKTALETIEDSTLECALWRETDIKIEKKKLIS